MLRTSPVLLAVVFFAATLSVSAAGLELRGDIVPSPGKATITLEGIYFPYAVQENCDSKGRFRFKKLEPGSYTATVHAPGLGEVVRTVEIAESLTGQAGYIQVTIPFQPSDESVLKTLHEYGTISISDYCTPPYATHQLEQARDALNRREIEKAKKHIERALRVAPEFADGWAELGRIELYSRQYAEAERHFSQALESDPSLYSALVGLGDALLTLRRFREARDINMRAVAERPDDPRAHSQLGLSHFVLLDEARAVRHLKRSKELDPGHFSHPQVLLARIYEHRGDRDEAIEELEDFISLHPRHDDSSFARNWLARLRQTADAAAVVSSGETGGGF